MMRAELQKMARTPRETILTHVQRFRQLADIAFPNQNATQMEYMIRWLCLGLKDREPVWRLMRRG